MAMLPINTALCSFGMSGRLFHAPFLHLDPGFSLYSVLERSKDLASALYPGILVRRSLEELLDDDAVELVIVNTPSYTHFELAKKALKAGKHVVVEKPFTATAKEAEELASLAQHNGKILTVFQNRRYDSDFRTVKKILAEGWLGPIVEAEIHYDRYNPVLSPKLHKETPGPAVGVVYDLGSHLIDQGLQLFGMPRALFADLGMTRPGSRVEDYMELLFFYPGDLRVRLKAGYFVREAFPSYTMHGTRGSFLKTRADIQERELLAGHQPGGEDWGKEPDSERGLLHTEKDGKLIRETVPTLQGNYGEYYKRLYEAIRMPGEKQPPVTPEEGIMTIRIIETAYRSHEEKRVIELR
jgi:scyllo-inositol 2-dehydrogenase (NADP+)